MLPPCDRMALAVLRLRLIAVMSSGRPGRYLSEQTSIVVSESREKRHAGERVNVVCSRSALEDRRPTLDCFHSSTKIVQQTKAMQGGSSKA